MEMLKNEDEIQTESTYINKYITTEQFLLQFPYCDNMKTQNNDIDRVNINLYYTHCEIVSTQNMYCVKNKVNLNNNVFECQHNPQCLWSYEQYCGIHKLLNNCHPCLNTQNFHIYPLKVGSQTLFTLMLMIMHFLKACFTKMLCNLLKPFKLNLRFAIVTWIMITLNSLGSLSSQVCPGNQYFNQTSSLCQTCAYGEFYVYDLNQCISCNNSCMGSCAYQLNCMQCNSSQVFDLSSFSCVDACNFATSVLINDTQLSISPVCRIFDYYVDPSSNNVIELGTRQYPFKHLGLVFVELLNFHSNSDRTINVYLRENTESYIDLSFNYIINITTVNILTYSLSSSTPSMANITAGEENDSNQVNVAAYFNNGTRFNILQSTKLRKAEKIFSNSKLSSTELNYLNQNNNVIIVHRSNFSIDNIIFKTVFDDINSVYLFFFAIYLQNKNFNITNAYFRTSGGIFLTYDPIVFNMQNIDVDYVNNNQGFVVTTTCNYPEAYLYGGVNITNITVYFSTGQTNVASSVGHVIRYTGSGYFIINGYRSSVFSPLTVNSHSVNYLLQAVCVPMLDIPHYMNFTGLNFSLTAPNNYMLLINIMVLQLYIDTYRTHKITVNNFTAENVVNNAYPSIWIIGNPFVENSFYSVYARNVSSQMSVIFSRATRFCIAKDFYFENSTASLQYLLSLTQTNNITVSNITLNDARGINTDAYSLVYLQTFSGGFITVDGFNVFNSRVDKHKGIYADTYGSNVRGNFALTNCVFKNVTMASGVKFIGSTILKSLKLSNITFSNMTQTSSSDTTNTLIKLGGLDLNSTYSFEISQISVSNSSISLLHLNSIYNTNITGKQIIISNISYHDSLFQFQDNLIKIDNIETDNDFYIAISNIVVSGITFVRGGNLILFQQQTASLLIAYNCEFTNNKGGSIHFEAYNKNNPNLTTNMQFENMTISNSNGYYQPLITVTAGSTILIYNSSFTKNCNYLKGGVASVDTLGASLRIFNSNFENNTSIQGGVFNVENQGLLSITNCVLNCNFAVQSGVIQSSNEGYFTIYSSQIVNNYAYSISVGELFLVSTQSLINNSTISNNQCLTKTYIIQQLDNCSALCFINSDFRNYLIQNSDLMDVNSIYSSLQLISSSLSIVNASSIANQSYVAECIQSNLTISDSSIKNLKIDSDLVYLSATTLNLNNITFERISVASADTSIIFGVLYSAVSANNVRYSNSSCRFINLDSSTLSIFKLTANSVSLDSYLMNFLSCYSISVADSNIYSINSASSSVIYSSNSQFDQIRNVTLLDLNTTGIDFSKSNVTQISRLLISRSPKGMKLKNTVISTFSSSQFVSCGSSNIVYGGAVDAIDSSIYLYNSTANQNIAQNGAAISIRCSNYDLCDNKIAGSSFESNAAEVKGGAIYYNFRRPQITDIKFTNNSAPYGSNIASYSVKIIEQTSKNASITFNNIPSGIKLGSTLELILQDYDNQTIPDSSYQIKISPITSNASVSGYDSARAVEGVASFKNLIFIFSPGSQHIRYKATSNAINAQSNNALGIPSYSTIDISFRYCKPGESQISKSECQTCAPGTYSFEWNSTSCTNCISDTICAGGAIVEVNPGYWRISTNSTTVLNCPYPSACLGGYDSESKYPVKCETGYIGYLCAECDIVDGVKYEKASGNLCNKCSDPVLNALKFIAIVIAAFAFLMIMIILILRKRKENQTSILIRILTNYLQLISLSMSFNLRFPSSLTQAFNAFDTIGSSSDTFLSYDCFFTSIQVTGFTPSVQLFKILLTGLLPLILFAACSLIWILLYYSMNKWFSNLKLNMVVSAICIIFLLHPTITKSALLVFECIVVDANDKRMKMYMEYKCYSAEHFTWIAFVSLPTLIVWVIGAPCLAFIILYKYRHNLEGNIKFYMLMLYQGYKPKVFYWEFVNTIRKVLVLCCSIFLSTEATIYRILCSILVLICILRIQIKLTPYKLEINNTLEQGMIICGSITLFCGVIFTNGSSSVALFSTFALLVLLICNIYFVVLWLFYFLVSLNLKHRYFKKIIEIYSYVILQNKFLASHKPTENSVNTLAEKVPKKRKKKTHKKLLKGKVKFERKNKIAKLVHKSIGLTQNWENLSLSVPRSNDNQDSHNRLCIENTQFKIKKSLNNDIPSILSTFKPKIVPFRDQKFSQISKEIYEISEDSKNEDQIPSVKVNGK